MTGRALAYAALFACALVAWLGCRAAAANATPAPVVYLVPVRGTVDLSTVPLVERAFDEAEQAQAAAVVLEIDTLGGRLDAAVAIRDRILASNVRSIAFVDPRAISAGALIALSTHSIVMNDGATIGAATPVQLQAEGRTTGVDEKTISYVRKEFRATAERRGRTPELAEAMVDVDVEIPGVVARGKLLTATTEEALPLRLADLRAGSLDQVLRAHDLADAERREVRLNWAEHVVRAVTHPVVSSLLMSLGMLGLFIELRTPGFAAPGIVGILCLALFFGGHWIARLAGLEELTLIGAGIVLLAIEVFAVPGFGITGLLGIAALALGLGLSLVGAGADAGAWMALIARVGISTLVAIAAFVAVLSVLPRARFARGLVLAAAIDPRSDARAGEAATTLVGERGRTLSPLRPAGRVAFREQRVDVVSDGDFIEAGVDVEAIRQEGNRVVVRRAGAQPGHEPSQRG